MFKFCKKSFEVSNYTFFTVSRYMHTKGVCIQIFKILSNFDL